jgi:hypothetical protein
LANLPESKQAVPTRYVSCDGTGTPMRPGELRWGWLKNGQCQFVELSKWTNAQGMTLIRSVPDVERLRLLLAETPPDAQLVCAKAGVIEFTGTLQTAPNRRTFWGLGQT